MHESILSYVIGVILWKTSIKNESKNVPIIERTKKCFPFLKKENIKRGTFNKNMVPPIEKLNK